MFYLFSYSFIRAFLFNHLIFLFTERRFRFGNTYGDTTRSLPVCMDTLGYSSGSYITMPVMWSGSWELIKIKASLECAITTGNYVSILWLFFSRNSVYSEIVMSHIFSVWDEVLLCTFTIEKTQFKDVDVEWYLNV